MNFKKGAFYQALNVYGHSDMYPMHMPGHKRNIQSNDPLDMIRLIDITEIPNFDDQYENSGYLKVVQDRYARLFHSENSRLMVNGSTGGILAAISCCVTPGDTILMARNAHKSAYNAVMINGLKTVYVYPQIDAATGITLGVDPFEIQKELGLHPEIKAVYLTSPTYEGIISDISSIAGIVHQKGIPLIVDEAHGPHLGMDPTYKKEYGMVSAVECGADIVIESLHKTLPAFTQSAIIHYRKGYIDIEKLERYLMVYQSSSPSYILLAGMERCIDILEENGTVLFEQYHNYLENFYHSVSDLKVLKVLNWKDQAYDRGKIVVFLAGKGKWLLDELREKYAIEVEAAYRDYIICMTSIMDQEEGFLRLSDALHFIDIQLANSDQQFISWNIKMPRPEVAMSIMEAMNNKNNEEKILSIHDLQPSSICHFFIYAYPPGIPIIAPGEIIDLDTIKYMESLEKCNITLKII